ncbi:MAG TPA: efflux RND transporter periplasmic adaptor subunit [Burkholderiales bacterium]|nr:efflux RND transporter periplasmic adaptor subunit [Burkholderiales bacterium]
MPHFPSILRSVLTLALLAGLVACSKEEAKPQRPVPEVGVLTATAVTIPEVATRIAVTESSRQVNVVARVSGFLENIAYKEGELVREGQVMFEMDKKPFIAQLESAKGELQAQQARLWTAEANLKRIKPLAEQNAVSQSDLDKATGEQRAAEAAVFAARANVEQAELNLSYATIRAPVTGLSGQSNQRQGAYLNAQAESASLTYVAQLDPIWISFSVSQNELAERQEKVAKGKLQVPADRNYVVEAVLPDGTAYPHKGRLDFADPSFNQQTGTFMVRASLPNPKSELRPGMFITARLLGAQRPNAILVPQKAVQQGSNGHMVWLVNKEGLAEPRPVVVGEWVGQEWVIEQGLAAGEKLVVDGFQKLAPGIPVKPVDAAAPTQGTPAKPAAGAEAPAKPK